MSPLIPAPIPIGVPLYRHGGNRKKKNDNGSTWTVTESKEPNLIRVYTNEDEWIVVNLSFVRTIESMSQYDGNSGGTIINFVDDRSVFTVHPFDAFCSFLGFGVSNDLES
jgi:hypothetical protein